MATLLKRIGLFYFKAPQIRRILGRHLLRTRSIPAAAALAALHSSRHLSMFGLPRAQNCFCVHSFRWMGINPTAPAWQLLPRANIWSFRTCDQKI